VHLSRAVTYVNFLFEFLVNVLSRYSVSKGRMLTREQEDSGSNAGVRLLFWFVQLLI